MTTIKAQIHQSKLPIATLHLKQPPIDTNRNFNKIATLEPYMADIEKKLKLKNKLSKNHKHKLNQSSSRSFRIKDISTASLHKLGFQKIDNNFKTIGLQKNKETVNTTGLLNNQKKIKPNYHNQQLHRQRKAKSQQQRPFQSSFSKTINVRQANNLAVLNGQKQPKDSRELKICPPQGLQKEKSSNSNTFNDYLLRNNNNKLKDNKQQKFRKNMYEIVLPKKNSVNSNSKKDSQSIKKISCTELHIDQATKKKGSQQQIDFINGKKTEIVRKNNFRRGKYQIAMHSSVNENLQPIQQHSHNPMHSQRLHNNNHQQQNESKLVKKDSTLSINHEMDILAQKQMIKFYQKIRTKQIQKSLEKSTEKYFGSDTYRPVKSKNQIQIYLSSLINPSINKTSQSTYDKDSRNKSPLNMKHKTDCYAYDFQFEDQKSPIHSLQHKINSVMENSLQQEQSISHTNEKLFEQQRRQAEILYFNKQNPNLQWSDDEDCQVDDV